MQTSGTCPPLSDGTRTTITTKAPKIDRLTPGDTRDRPSPKTAPAAPHRGGGHAKHAKRGK